MHEVTYLRPVMEVDFSCILSISWSCSTVAVVAFGQRKSHDRQLANGNSIGPIFCVGLFDNLLSSTLNR